MNNHFKIMYYLFSDELLLNNVSIIYTLSDVVLPVLIVDQYLLGQYNAWVQLYFLRPLF